MNIIDYVLIGIVIFMALLGIKRGAIKSLVYLCAIILVVVISYQFKSVFANQLMTWLPFFKFDGELASATSLNLLAYQGVSFVILFLILLILLSIIIKISGLLDLIVKVTFILEIPSKIIGLLIGAIEGVLIAYAFLFVGMQAPSFQKLIVESKFGIKVLDKTPYVNNIFKKSNSAAKDIYDIVEGQVKGTDEKEDINEDIEKVLKNDGIVSSKSIKKLKKKGKLVVDKIKDTVDEDDAKNINKITKEKIDVEKSIDTINKETKND